MILLWVLRIALFAQLLLGLGRFFGLVVEPRVWETHISLGIVIVVLALVALRPRAGVLYDGLRIAARFFPLAPLLTGLGMTFALLPRDLALILVHMLLGLATIGLVEAAAARQRRALRSPTGPGP